jgi:conjugal transfer pilus assembly protein TrbC
MAKTTTLSRPQKPRRMSAELVTLSRGLAIALIGSFLISVFTGKARAQPSPRGLPSDIQLQEATRAQSGASSKAIEEAARSAQSGAKPGSGHAGAAPSRMPNIDTPAPAGVDPAEVMRQFNALKKGEPTEGAMPDHGLIVFISMGMPKASLERLLDQSARHKFVLVMRGLPEESMTRSIARIRALIGERNADIQIDPRLFERFAIAQVPAVVVLAPDTQATGVVYGDVTVDYALEHMVYRMPKVAGYAKQLLDRMRQ